ncbi:MAG: ribbon-helix-helix protein, CopG family [Mobiluncus porci]|nr:MULTISPECIES: ribbon-helix-helix protein, CopG family [Mobiluncus]MDD7542535.1 ribbon-helix-helix protein, CopG family [Mobiluncus porci]MDY5748832.1 ribbon-helix-helix protein, CopG family [Mobiluncus porci]
MPVAMKRAIAEEAKKENVTTSELVRALLTKSLIEV